MLSNWSSTLYCSCRSLAGMASALDAALRSIRFLSWRCRILHIILKMTRSSRSTHAFSSSRSLDSASIYPVETVCECQPLYRPICSLMDSSRGRVCFVIFCCGSAMSMQWLLNEILGGSAITMQWLLTEWDIASMESLKSKVKSSHGQNHPWGESTTTFCEINYQLLQWVMLLKEFNVALLHVEADPS